MRRLTRTLLFLVGAVGFAAGVAVERVEPGEAAARDGRTLGPGLRLRVPMLHAWTVRPIRGSLGFGPPSEHRLVSVPTSDGHRVGVALTADWHLVGEGSLPADLADVRAALGTALADHFGGLTLREVATPLTLEQRAVDARPVVDAGLAELKVALGAIHVHALRLPPETDARIRGALLSELQVVLEEANKAAEDARSTATAAKGAAGTAVEAAQRSWDDKDAEVRRALQSEIDGLRAEADAYARTKRAEAEAAEARLLAEGKLALARAAALKDKLTADALTGEAGRLHTAIEAARAFKVGDLDPAVRGKLTTMVAWRRFFLGRASPRRGP